MLITAAQLVPHVMAGADPTVELVRLTTETTRTVETPYLLTAREMVRIAMLAGVDALTAQSVVDNTLNRLQAAGGMMGGTYIALCSSGVMLDAMGVQSLNAWGPAIIQHQVVQEALAARTVRVDAVASPLCDTFGPDAVTTLEEVTGGLELSALAQARGLKHRALDAWRDAQHAVVNGTRETLIAQLDAAQTLEALAAITIPE